MELIFNGYSTPTPKVYRWKVNIPFELQHEIEEEIFKIYGRDAKFSINTSIGIDVFVNEDGTNLTTEQVLKLTDTFTTKKEVDIL